MSHVRLQKYIAAKGICSRRKAEELISLGKVLVNGELVTEMGVKVDPSNDTVTVDTSHLSSRGPKGRGDLVEIPTSLTPLDPRNESVDQFVYIALNKPIDYISSASSEQGASVLELLTEHNQLGKHKTPLTARVYPVGRLDKDSEGLLLLTNDGELTNQLTHPRYEHEKEYEVTIDERMNKEAKKMLEKGMHIDGEDMGGMTIKHISNRGKRTIVTVILREGKNRQIRRMFARVGYHVISLKRTRMSNLTLGSIPIGRWIYVSKKDII